MTKQTSIILFVILIIATIGVIYFAKNYYKTNNLLLKMKYEEITTENYFVKVYNTNNNIFKCSKDNWKDFFNQELTDFYGKQKYDYVIIIIDNNYAIVFNNISSKEGALGFYTGNYSISEVLEIISLSDNNAINTNLIKNKEYFFKK